MTSEILIKAYDSIPDKLVNFGLKSNATLGDVMNCKYQHVSVSPDRLTSAIEFCQSKFRNDYVWSFNNFYFKNSRDATLFSIMF